MPSVVVNLPKKNKGAFQVRLYRSWFPFFPCSVMRSKGCGYFERDNEKTSLVRPMFMTRFFSWRMPCLENEENKSRANQWRQQTSPRTSLPPFGAQMMVTDGVRFVGVSPGSTRMAMLRVSPESDSAMISSYRRTSEGFTRIRLKAIVERERTGEAIVMVYLLEEVWGFFF